MRQGLVIAMVLLVGCREGPFAAAAKQDTAQGWREFISRNPDDDRLAEAQDRLTELEFDEARAAHSVVAYKRFLDAHPGAPQQPAALALLEGLRFQAASAAGTAAGWRQFLRDHPDGARSADASAQLKALEARRWLTEEDPAALEALVKAAPATEAGVQAAEKLEALAWSRAATPSAFQAYLDAYPAGSHRDQAKAKLLEAELLGLLVSGAAEEARAVYGRSPLKALLPAFPRQLETALAAQAAARAKGAEQALVAWYLRPEGELERSLEAPDPLERWQAAQELGEVVSVKHLEALLGVLKRSRSALVRFRAFEALQRVVAALPAPVAELELGRRRAALAAVPADAQSALVLAVLDELSGDGARAAAGYRRCLTEGAVDPLALWRWSTLARAQGRAFSSAVAAA
ncbi:MAG: HEAT repeat domain-containing protein, partial [Myxococcaceae bacterium]|nr:HEAT repeat domain-containing protein [Myxococcaceae bacterium]